MNSKTRLTSYLQELESLVPKYDLKSPKVSRSTIGWQIDHSLKVINMVSKALIASDPKLYKNNFTLIGRLLLWLGYFPRGKAKAPKQVQPSEVISIEDLKSQIKEARAQMESLAHLEKNAHFNHPLFGTINLDKAIRFLEVHTQHHLKIIRDMLKS
jgi:hypothetical protein